MDDWRVTSDRKADRHDPEKRGRLIRPDPPDLWDRLGALVGPRRRSETISDLIRRYLDGEPMPARPKSTKPKAAPRTSESVDPPTFVAPVEPEARPPAATPKRWAGRPDIPFR